MSKNFELMQQAGKDQEFRPIHKPEPAPAHFGNGCGNGHHRETDGYLQEDQCEESDDSRRADNRGLQMDLPQPSRQSATVRRGNRRAGF